MDTKKRKTIATGFALWEYNEEERFLNNKSAQGLQLLVGRCFNCVFEEDSSVRYTYQLDFNPGKNNDERYIELFAEQGWKYVNSTWNGWHYFKKPYQQGQQDARGNVVTEERIYTDSTSRAEMESRWIMLARFLMIFYALLVPFYLIGSIRLHSIAFALFGLDFLIFGLTVAIGVKQHVRKNREPGYTPAFVLPFRVVISIFLAVAVIAFVLSILQF